MQYRVQHEKSFLFRKMDVELVKIFGTNLCQITYYGLRNKGGRLWKG